MTIWKIRFDNLNYEQIVKHISITIENKELLTIGYINFYSTLATAKENDLFFLINKFNLVHLDGVGIYWALKYLGNREVKRFNWTDHVFNFLKVAELNGWKLIFLGGNSETIQNGREHIKIQFPNLKLLDWFDGYSNYVDDELVAKINQNKPDIVWVGMGFPKQEKWIIQNSNLLNTNVLQAVGDAFNLLSGTKKRGTKIIQKIGFEWLVRLIHNPRLYWKRYLIGIPIFIYKIILEKRKIKIL